MSKDEVALGNFSKSDLPSEILLRVLCDGERLSCCREGSDPYITSRIFGDSIADRFFTNAARRQNRKPVGVTCGAPFTLAASTHLNRTCSSSSFDCAC